MPRDSQRQRVYDAETEFNSRSQKAIFTSIEEAQQFVNSILTSRWFQLHFALGHKSIFIKRMPKNSKHSDANALYGRIRLASWDLHKEVVLHELAHLCRLRGLWPMRGQQAHGWEFCATFLKLVAKYMCTEDARVMTECFRKHKVRFRPKRKSSYAKGVMPPGFAALQVWREKQKTAA